MKIASQNFIKSLVVGQEVICKVFGFGSRHSYAYFTVAEITETKFKMLAKFDKKSYAYFDKLGRKSSSKEGTLDTDTYYGSDELEDLKYASEFITEMTFEQLEAYNIQEDLRYQVNCKKTRMKEFYVDQVKKKTAKIKDFNKKLELLDELEIKMKALLESL